MGRTTEDRTRGIRWTLLRALEDLDLADNLALVSHTHQHIQEETSRLNTYAQQIGLKISQKKTGDDIEHPKLPPVEKIYQRLSSLPTQASTVRCDRGAVNNV